MDLPGKPIAFGRTAEIYPWKPGQVLKLFNHGISRRAVESEAGLTHTVHATGIPVPAVGEIIEVNGRFGLEYERVDGITMLNALLQAPWKLRLYARQLAELQAEMHTRHLPELPSMRERLERKIRSAELLPDDLRQVVLSKLACLPEEDRLCHGDFHPGNILLTSQGPVIIDWIDASSGYPAMDVARSTLLMSGGPLPPGTPMAGLVKLIRYWYHNIYLHRYFQLTSSDRKEVIAWLPVAAAARLDEGIKGDEDRLLSLARMLQTS